MAIGKVQLPKADSLVWIHPRSEYVSPGYDLAIYLRWQGWLSQRFPRATSESSGGNWRCVTSRQADIL